MEKKVKVKLLEIPGYRGYQSLEDRRDDDKRLREAIALQLATVTSSLTALGARLASERRLQQISAVERLVGATRLLGDRVRTTSYGYGGLFSNQPVGAPALNQLRQFDAAFQQEVGNLSSLADRLAESPEGPLAVDIAAFSDELSRLDALFDARSAVVETAQPSQDAEVMELLETQPQPKVSQVAQLRVGDALSVLGDNFIVEAVVAFGEAEASVQLARIGRDEADKEIWLLGGSSADVPTAKLTPTPESQPITAAGQRAEARISTSEKATESAGAQYWVDTGQGGQILFRYDVGNESRNFVGKLVVDEDIQVYGQA